MSGLDKAITKLGSQKLLAEACGVEPMAVSLWKRNGVPSGRVLSICAATNWSITPHDLRPDLYPDKDWMPQEARIHNAS